MFGDFDEIQVDHLIVNTSIKLPFDELEVDHLIVNTSIILPEKFEELQSQVTELLGQVERLREKYKKLKTEMRCLPGVGKDYLEAEENFDARLRTTE